jgi:hypothetical protein
MDLLTVSRVVSAVALVIGILFGMLQLRQYDQRRRRENALELVHSFQPAAFAKALETILRMPQGLDRREVEAWAAGREGDRRDFSAVLPLSFRG